MGKILATNNGRDSVVEPLAHDFSACLRNNGAAIVFSEIITLQKKPREVFVEDNLARSTGPILSGLFGRPRRAKLCGAHPL